MIQRLSNVKVMVTGGAGFIGCHLCEALLREGAYVTSIDDLSAGKAHNYSFFEQNPRFRSFQIDVTDRSSLEPVFAEGIDIVFHNAASKKTVCLHNPHRDLEVNAGGALALLQLSKKYGVKKFVHASTGSVYGEPVSFPTAEEHPLHPVSFYGVSKLAGERYVGVFEREFDLNTTVLRYFHVYGPRQESNEFGGVVSIFLRKILEAQNLTIFGDGSQLRSFTWVLDIVEANIRAAIMPVSRGKVYNCASGLQISIKDLAEGLIGLAGTKARSMIEYSDWMVGDIKYFDVDNAKIKNDLGMEFCRDFWPKMKETYQDYEAYLLELEKV